MNFGINLNLPLAATEWWLTRWLTPFWIFGIGILFGLILLAILFGIIVVLSKIPILETLRRNGSAFWIGLIGGLAATAAVAYPLRKFFTVGGTDFVFEDEWWLSMPPLWVIFSLIIWSLLYCSNNRFVVEFIESLTAGIGSQILSVLAIIVVLAGISTLAIEQPVQMLSGLPQLFFQGQTIQTVTLDGVPESLDAGQFVPVKLDYNPTTVRRVSVQSDRNVVLEVSDVRIEYLNNPIRVTANEPLNWSASEVTRAPIPIEPGYELLAQNLEYESATITFIIQTAAAQSEMIAVVTVGFGIVLIGLAWFLQLGVSPRLAAIALATAKSEYSQPLPKILMIFVGFCIVAFVFVPFHTLGEDIKLLKDCGVTLIMVACLFQGIWSASSSVSEEIEGRTALTLLSKPITRRSFIFGKLFGILWVLALMWIVLGTLELVAVAYKPLYEAQENSLEQPLWQLGYIEMFRTLPGLVMVFFQVTTLTTLAVALATRLPQLANFAVCFTVYLVGHLTPSIVDSSQDAFPIVQFVAQLIAVITPNLNMYSMDGAIDANTPIPTVYLSALLLYSALSCGMSILIGLLFFEDRDLA